MGYIYDPNINVPNNKTDGNRPSIPSDWVASDANLVANVCADIRTAITTGNYHGLRDMAEGTLPVSAALGASIAALSGRVAISLNGAAYGGILKAAGKITNPMDYGAKWDGVTNDDAAITDAIDAWMQTASLGGMLLLPAGDCLITTPLTLLGILGGSVTGSGRRATRFIWGGDPGADIFVVNSCQRTTLQGFSIYVPTGRSARRALSYDYNPVPPPAVATANTIRDILVDAADTAAIDVDLYFSGAYGNNSEFFAEACYFGGFGYAGVQMPNTQAKSMNFVGCQANGGWDGTTGHAGGQYGVTTNYTPGPPPAGGGSFQWFMGGVAACRTSAFQVAQGNDPFMVWGTQSEQCYRFFTGVSPLPGDSPNAGISAISIQLNRIDSVFDHAEDVILLNGAGPYDVRFNQFNSAATAPLPKIKIKSSTPLTSVVVRSNLFSSVGSVAEPAILLEGQEVMGIDLGGNVFLDSGSVVAPRVEAFDVIGPTATFTQPTGTSLHRSAWPNLGPCSPAVRVDFGALSIAGTTKNLKIYSVPRGWAFRGAYIYQYEYFTGTSITAVSMRLGTASAGNQFLLDYDAHTTDNLFVGAAPAELGTALTTDYAQGRYLGSFTANTDVWLQAVSTGANLSALTRGYCFLILDLVEVPRFVFAV